MLEKREFKLSFVKFVLLLSGLNLLFFHYSFFKFVLENVNYASFWGGFLVISLLAAVIVANAFVFGLLTYFLKKVARVLIGITFLISAVSVYFIITYGVIVDESMIGNVFNTKYSESSSYFSWKMVILFLLMGVLPMYAIMKVKVERIEFRKFLKYAGGSLLFLVVISFANAVNWLWIDKHSKQLGGLVMPWSYTVNSALYQIHKSQENEKEIILPDAKIKNKEKSVFVLVIGESARRSNFSLYGYGKKTTPLLEKVQGLAHFNATSCATYTTGGVKCMLSYKDSGDLYEILPNYLFRTGVDVVWRTSNWGEPPVHIDKYIGDKELVEKYKVQNAQYDEVLLAGLKDEILQSKKDKILIILHTSTSHGPSYNKKYPPNFEVFKPVCQSVELGQCSKEELVNAYDNTIVYTDFLLNKIIEELKGIEGYKSSMMYVSDHGESLGESNLYMHGVPMSFAPKEQYEIPFIVWSSAGSRKIRKIESVDQGYVFHSVLDFLGIESEVYNGELSVYEKE